MEKEIIEVKVEPFDNEYNEDLQWMQQEEQQEPLLVAAAATPPPTKMEINCEEELIIKTEVETGEELDTNKNILDALEMEGMCVVEEQQYLITVNAGCNKSEDEKTFMANCVPTSKPPRRRKQVFFNETCSECQQSFNIRRSYEQHKEFGLCNILENKKRCVVCPLSFSTQVQVDEHLKLHKLNRFFCTKNCGKLFNTLDECRLHEYRAHQVRNIMCSVCNHKFFSCNALIHHMKSHSALKRFACSFCRDWFSCSIDLAKHWQVQKTTCGKLMQDVVHHTMMAIEKTLPVFNDITTKVQFVDRVNLTEPPKKRSKVTSKYSSAEEKKSDNFSLKKTFISLNDLRIKREPSKISDDQQSTLTNATSTMESFTNITIKSEPEDPVCDGFKIKDEPVSDNEEEIEQQNMGTAVQEKILLKSENQTIPSIMMPQNGATFMCSQINSTGSNNIVWPNSALAKRPPINSADRPTAPNLIKVTLPSVKTASTNTPPSVKPLQLQNQNIKLPPINLTGYKIFKILPNSKLLRLPADAAANKASQIDSTTSPPAPIILKLKSPPEATTTMTAPLVADHSTVDTKSAKWKKVWPEHTTIVNSNVCTNTLTDFAPMMGQRKNNCKTKYELQMIESIPQKRALIDNLKEQIKQFIEPTDLHGSGSDSARSGKCANVKSYSEKALLIKEEKDNDDSSFEALGTMKNIPVTLNKDIVTGNEQISDDVIDDENDNNALIIDEGDYGNDAKIPFDFPTENYPGSSITDITMEATTITNPLNATKDLPPTFFISVTSDSDPELQGARRKYQNYRYEWKCPRCPRRYAQKYSFRGHLVGAHGYCKEEFSQLFAEVKPFLIPKSLEEINELTVRHTHQQLVLESEGESQESSNTNQLSENGETKERHSSTSTLDISDGERKHSTRLTCPKCGRKCCTRTALNDHILANCSREPQYPCSICPKRFYSASTLNQHISIHTGILPHKCSYCDKRFRTRGQVTVHHRTHTGERPFECQVCSQRFTHRETLISHLSRHIGMKRYKCYGCNQQFACISGLKTHREVRASTCGKVKLNTRAIGPRVRVIKGNVVFEAQPEINPYLRTEDPEEVLSKTQNANS